MLEAGLTEAQAATYIKLVENSPITPPALSELCGESRTNMYKLLESLEEIGLAERDESQKKLRYWAKSPDALLDLTKKRLEEATLANKKLNVGISALRDDFFKHSEQAGIRFFQGKEGLRQIFNDQINSKQSVYYIRSVADVVDFDSQEMHNIRNEFVKNKIKRYGITQDFQSQMLPPDKRIDIAESDKMMLLNRTWIKKEDYTAPVEWATYGDKLSIISFGAEVTGTIIESKQIAESFRQIFKLLDRQIRTDKDYDKFPHYVKYTAIPESLKK